MALSHLPVAHSPIGKSPHPMEKDSMMSQSSEFATRKHTDLKSQPLTPQEVLALEQVGLLELYTYQGVIKYRKTKRFQEVARAIRPARS